MSHGEHLSGTSAMQGSYLCAFKKAGKSLSF